MEISYRGNVLKEYLFSLDVEHNWLQNQYVDWLTGTKKIIDFSIPDNLDSFYTHCSSFVSSVCYQLHVPFLIPNTHIKTEGFANKQCIWLHDYGNANSWIQIHKNNVMHEANKGYLIVATYYNLNDCNCGHIAIVCPCEQSNQSEQSEICVCQAGLTNSSCMNILKAFTHHDDVIYWKYLNIIVI
jgi:hypothetical protein